MNLFDRINHCLPSLTKSERTIAEYILQYPIDVIRSTSDELAKNAGSSKSAVIRLCQKLDYQGYSEFKYDMNHCLTSSTASSISYPDSTVNQITDYYMEQFQKIKNMVNPQDLSKLASYILETPIVHVIAYSHTGYSSAQMAFRLLRFGINSHYLNDLPLMQAYRSIVKPKDLVVLFSISGSDRYTEYFHSYKESGCTCVLITMNPKSVLFKDADLAICLPCASKSSTTLFLDDQLIFYLFIEILIAEIARQKKEFL